MTKRLKTIAAAALALASMRSATASPDSEGMRIIKDTLNLNAKSVQDLGAGTDIEITPVQVTRVVKALKAAGYKRYDVGDNTFALRSKVDDFFVSDHDGKSYISLDVE